MAWNDTDLPLAYFITFRAYGTWLRGDARGSIDGHNNAYGNAKYGREDNWHEITNARLKQGPVKLDAKRRRSIEKAILETCEKLGWTLLGLNIRTNHVHIVVAIGLKKPSIALNAFKANATRVMREDECWASRRSPWADKGSERWLWTESHVYDAVNYVLHGQGDDLPKFD